MPRLHKKIVLQLSKQPFYRGHILPKKCRPKLCPTRAKDGGLEQGTGPFLFLDFWLFLVVLLFVVVLYLGVLWGTRCRRRWGRPAVNEAVLSRNLANHRRQIGAYRRPGYSIRPPGWFSGQIQAIWNRVVGDCRIPDYCVIKIIEITMTQDCGFNIAI